MNTAIIASSKDPAGANIRNNLIRLFNFEKIGEKFGNTDIFQYDKIQNKKIRLYLINDDLIYAENIDKKIPADVFIFASKHRSKENTPSFAIHPIGNWGKADFGGEEKKICFSSAVLLKNLFVELNKVAKYSNYEITMEATHHGPYVEKPAVFVEIGSTEKEWNDAINGEITAKTIMKVFGKEDQNYISCVLVGGGHYNQAANKLMLRTNYEVGHICPKYALEYLDEEMLMQTINKTIPKPEIVLVDWKGLGQYKQKTIALLEKLKIKYERVQNIL